MRNVIARTLAQLKAQEQALEGQIVALNEQLLMTRGAVQVLEHLLPNLPDEVEGAERDEKPAAGTRDN